MPLDTNSPGHLSRRRFLRAISVAGVAGIAGCSDGGSEAEAEDSPSPIDTTVDTATTAGDETEKVTPTETETPTETTTPTETETPAKNIDEMESKVTDVRFQGNFLDTHAHWHGAKDTRHDILNPQTLATRYDNQGIGGCALFTASTEVTSNYAGVLQDLVTQETEFLPFLEPYGDHLLQGTVTDVYSKHPDVFWGIGEIVFYAGPFEGTSLTDDPWPKLFGFSANEDVPLMIHPTLSQESGLKKMLSKYPDATVLGHGGEYNLERDALEPLLKQYDNLYWTLDAGSMLNGLVLRADGAEDFASRYDQRKSDYYNLVENTLPWMMNAAPNRVTWGTDLATDWNTDPKVISRVMDWTQAALDSLPAEQQDKYAYANAKGLFGL